MHYVRAGITGISRKYIYIYIYIYMGFFVSIIGRLPNFALDGPWGGSIIGRKGGGRSTKILPAKQNNFGEFFGQPFGENIFSLLLVY